LQVFQPVNRLFVDFQQNAGRGSLVTVNKTSIQRFWQRTQHTPGTGMGGKPEESPNKILLDASTPPLLFDI
jgi:hypothetical protein